MRCPVLTSATPSVLRVCYAMSGIGTEICIGTERRCPVLRQAMPSVLLMHFAMSGTDVGYAATRSLASSRKQMVPPYALLRDVRLCSYSSVLRVHYALSGTERGYAATSLYQECVFLCLISGCICLRARSAVSGTDVAYGATRLRQGERTLAEGAMRCL
eukprot:3838591-Rhodomonas_salina.1